MMGQQILRSDGGYQELDKYFRVLRAHTLLLVCGHSASCLEVGRYFDTLEERLGIKVVKFSGFTPNPQYAHVMEGVSVFNAHDCEAIAAVGGGSAMDVAKCIKLYSGMDRRKNYLEQVIVPNHIPFLAVPTTAGSGSEATRYAVIYYNGEKQSVTNESCIPTAVLLDPSTLRCLPEYQRKCTVLDALCHALESYWSVNSTDESKGYSKVALGMILEHMEPYLCNDETGNAAMLEAAHFAGKAINIAQTTAGHAMCYKLTSFYGISHGHAAALCVAKLWPYMLHHTEDCLDVRGPEYLRGVFAEIAGVMGCVSADAAVGKFQSILKGMRFRMLEPVDGDIRELAASVNPVRLKNNPVGLDDEAIMYLYRQIFEK